MSHEEHLHPKIEVSGVDALDKLRPLWLCLHHHHQAIAPGLAPYVDDATSWTIRRRFYADCLAHPDSFLLLAYAGTRLAGYALIRVEETSTMWSDTWVTGGRTAELETIIVAPEWRSRGIGGLLFDHVESEIERRGIQDVIIGALPTNSPVLELYRRRGFEPTWLVMTRFGARRGS